VQSNTVILAAALAAASTCAGAQAPVPSAAQTLAATCANCHGTEGRSQGAVPSIAGQSKADLMEKMTAFRQGTRPATIMHQLAKGYTPEQIELLAEWFAKKPK
jgi:cytochrome c553